MISLFSHKWSLSSLTFTLLMCQGFSGYFASYAVLKVETKCRQMETGTEKLKFIF